MQLCSTSGRRVIAAVLILSIPYVITAGEFSSRYIVEATDIGKLEDYCQQLGIEVKPLIYYPNPSEETMELYGDQYILKFSTADQSTVNMTMNKLEKLSWVESITPDEILDVHPIEYYDEAYPDENSSAHQVMTPNPYTPNDPRYPDQWDKPLTETDMAWNSTTGEGATVAILDTGVDSTHEDLVDNLYMGYNFYDDNTDYSDYSGHGTRTCGVAGAKIDNGVGIAGVAGNAKIMPLRLLGSEGIPYSTIINCVNYAIDNGGKIINMSWGSYTYSSTMNNIMNNAWDRGAFLVGGAANDNTDAPFYPASYDKVMNVGATTSADERWSSSNYGPYVQIFAPGGLSTNNGGGYGGVQPTSWTCPQISGLAALVWSAHPSYTNYEVWLAILRGADTIDSDVGPILRMNSRGALEADVSVNELIPEPLTTSAASIQHGSVRLSCPASTEYTLRVFDASGRQVLAQQGCTTVSGEIVCNPDLGGGIYFWRFKTVEGVTTGKMVYVK